MRRKEKKKGSYAIEFHVELFEIKKLNVSNSVNRYFPLFSIHFTCV